MSRLFVVSNRVAVPNADKPAAGGLAMALNGALEQYGGIWFGWSGTTRRDASTEVTVIDQGKAGFALIDLDRKDYDDFYKGYANRSLWPLFHFRTDLTVFEPHYRDAYQRVNRQFAERMLPLLRPDDLIWIHDYHLIPCARELRDRGCQQRIGFFLHIPFPGPQVLTASPDHRQLVEALFSYDLVGFQTEADVRALRDYVLELADGREEPDGRLTAFGRTIRAQAFPIGMEVEQYIASAGSAEVAGYHDAIRQHLSGQQLLIGLDRLDYSKGIPERLAGFAELLAGREDYCGKITLLQLAAASREDVPEYARIRKQVETRVGRINGQFGQVDWVPVRYMNQTIPREQVIGLLRASRLSLVTPLRDGMNLVAKEYVAAQNPDDPGVLVLSHFAGAADQCRDAALMVNPYDAHEIAAAIDQGLTMSIAERQERWQSLLRTVKDYDIHWWRTAFIDTLQNTH